MTPLDLHCGTEARNRARWSMACPVAGPLLQGHRIATVQAGMSLLVTTPFQTDPSIGHWHRRLCRCGDSKQRSTITWTKSRERATSSKPTVFRNGFPVRSRHRRAHRGADGRHGFYVRTDVRHVEHLLVGERSRDNHVELPEGRCPGLLAFRSSRIPASTTTAEEPKSGRNR